MFAGSVVACFRIRLLTAHLVSILRSPIDLNCISDKLLSRIAERFTVEELESIKDRKDKVTTSILHTSCDQCLLLLAAGHAVVLTSCVSCLHVSLACSLDREQTVHAQSGVAAE